MQAIITSAGFSVNNEKEPQGLKSAAAAAAAPVLDWSTMYTRKPAGNRTLFELEAMMAKRMELLAWIDQLQNSPNGKGFNSILDEIGARLPQERRKFTTHHAAGHVLLGSDDPPTAAADDAMRARTPRRSSSRTGSSSGNAFIFEVDEDLLSHLLARYACCMSEKWRKWFVRTEETLLRARLKLQLAKCESEFLPTLMKENGLPCDPLSEEQRQDVRLQEYVQYDSALQGKNQMRTIDEYLSVPLTLATRLIKTRSVLCLKGEVILHRDQAQEVFLTVFRSKLNKGLHEAYLARMKSTSREDENENEEEERETVMRMVDAFLDLFVLSPEDAMQEATSGAIGVGDVRRLAQTHFPLCMRQIDEHLRREGHLKHHGRFTYGLFLKAIGLSLEDSMTLFSSLMTQKGGAGAGAGGNTEAFAKTAYGYNIRHNYGMEGKKANYSSASCATLMALPPVVDRFDCHGCPFRFKDEVAFRSMLQKEQYNPLGKDYPAVRPTTSDIEDIIQDCKGQHYTRACYKYFMSTHPGAKRDTLFRSPYEYYTVSREVSEKGEEAAGGQMTTPMRQTAGGDNFKRSMFTPNLREDVIRQRTSP
ncbi:DNA primase large subunit [Trypanosoma theileri]|uniref:DNA primase large subunit n=1 Tax=Trypanosoma theileri TaxID=67003 RepID=A0A1X0P8Q6_9TRYP|nr:DNA primase large subunit [Trypanosoma theileri]ORC93302.1 DNA primase large subunit [Trypanosoma theileri]